MHAMDPGGKSNGESTDVRLTRIEEHLGFVEHSSDQLSKEVLEIHRLLAALDKRLASLEHRFDKFESPTEDPAAG